MENQHPKSHTMFHVPKGHTMFCAGNDAVGVSLDRK